MASISCRHIYKIYPGNVTAVKDFNLEIADKEFIVFVGPSGCGKSTTLRMIAGLEEISKGEMYIGERLINDVPPKDRDIAMVFQNYALYPHMTVYKNMAFGLELRKMPKDEIDKRVREAAKILEIEHLLDRKPKALSGGQRQRVALGRAMVRNPAVFLLDEPLSNLDAKLRTSMRTEIIKLHKKLATTFIYVTHDQTEAMTMGDRIVVMRDGVIQQVDTPQNLYDYPCNIFVAGFIGSPQMNFLDGTLIKKGDLYGVDLGGDVIPLPKEKTADGKLDSYVGKKIKMGIRPEDIDDEPEFMAKHTDCQLDAQVDVSEMMGAEIYLYLEYKGNKMTARVAPTSKARNGDIVKVDVAELDENGNEIEESKSTDFTFTVGSGYNRFKIDSDIIGMSAGEEKTFDKTYGEDEANETLKGKTLKLHVKVNEVKYRDLPKVDDDFAQDVKDEYKTVEDLKAGIKADFEKRLEDASKNIKADKIVNAIAKSATIAIPQSMIDYESENYWQRFVKQMGIPEEQFVSYLQLQGSGKETLVEGWKESIIEDLKKQMILDEIRKKEDFKIDEKAFEDKCNEEIKDSYSPEQKEYLKSAIKDEMQYAETVPFLLANNTFKDGETVSFEAFMNPSEE